MQSTMPTALTDAQSAQINVAIEHVNAKTTQAFRTNESHSLVDLLVEFAPELEDELRCRSIKWSKKRSKQIRKVAEHLAKQQNGPSSTSTDPPSPLPSKLDEFCAALCHTDHTSWVFSEEGQRKLIDSVCPGLKDFQLDKQVTVNREAHVAQRRGQPKFLSHIIYGGDTGAGKSTIRPLLILLGRVGLGKRKGSGGSMYHNDMPMPQTDAAWVALGKHVRQLCIKPVAGSEGGERIVVPENMHPNNFIQVITRVVVRLREGLKF